MIESELITRQTATPTVRSMAHATQDVITSIRPTDGVRADVQRSTLIAGRSGGAPEEFSQSVAAQVSDLLTPGIPLPVVRFDQDECEFHALWLHRGRRVEISVPENDDVFVHSFGLSNSPESMFYKELPTEHVRNLLAQLYTD